MDRRRVSECVSGDEKRNLRTSIDPARFAQQLARHGGEEEGERVGDGHHQGYFCVKVSERTTTSREGGGGYEVPALPRDQKNTTEPHMLSRNGTRYCATHTNLNLKSRIVRLV